MCRPRVPGTVHGPVGNGIVELGAALAAAHSGFAVFTAGQKAHK
ncbi:MAG TPA: hypothetical protein VN749_11610 [Candidatus Eisenbacteria bacterium]|nr:hypothetical protein [Candidatus Eisenbacteria bacterium]